METRPGGRWLTNLTPWSWERCWSTFREGKGDDFSLRKAFFVRLHDEFENYCEKHRRRPDQLGAGGWGWRAARRESSCI